MLIYFCRKCATPVVVVFLDGGCVCDMASAAFLQQKNNAPGGALFIHNFFNRTADRLCHIADARSGSVVNIGSSLFVHFNGAAAYAG